MISTCFAYDSSFENWFPFNFWGGIQLIRFSRLNNTGVFRFEAFEAKIGSDSCD